MSFIIRPTDQLLAGGAFPHPLSCNPWGIGPPTLLLYHIVRLILLPSHNPHISVTTMSLIDSMVTCHMVYLIIRQFSYTTPTPPSKILLIDFTIHTPTTQLHHQLLGNQKTLSLHEMDKGNGLFCMAILCINTSFVISPICVCLG